MNEKRTNRKYSDEFKEEVVALVTEQGYSVAQAAESLGIRSNQHYLWKQKLTKQNGDDALSPDEKAELQKLRKENKRLRMEKEIPKKASAFFAKAMK